MAVMAERYAREPNVVFEFFNEYNWGMVTTPEQYIQIVRAGCEELREVNPNVITTFGGKTIGITTYRPPEEEQQFWTGFKQLHDEGLVDLMAYHEHYEMKRLLWNLDIENVYRRTAGVDSSLLFLNEAGYSDSGEKHEQASEVVKKAIWALANGERGYVFFQLRGLANTGYPDFDDRWSAVTADNQIRDVFITYGVFIQKMQGTTPKRIYASGNLDESVHLPYYAFLFEKNGKDILVVFKGIDYAPDHPITVPGSYTVYDMYGNTVANWEPGIYTDPFYLEFN